MGKNYRSTVQDASEFIKKLQKFNELSTPKKEETNPNLEIGLTPLQILNGETDQETEEDLTPEKPNVVYGGFRFWPEKDENFREEAITFIDYFYSEYKKLPNLADFRQRFSDSQLPGDMDEWKLFFIDTQDALLGRGIPPYETPSDYLEPNFILAVQLITNPLDKRTIAAKLKDANLTSAQWKNLLRKKVHQEYYTSRVNEIFNEDARNSAKLALVRLIEAGDLQAIKHFHELHQQNVPKEDPQLIVLHLMTQVMDILSRHVAADVLQRVAAEVKTAVIDVPSKQLSA